MNEPIVESLTERQASKLCWKAKLRGNPQSKDRNLSTFEGKRGLLTMPFHGHIINLTFQNNGCINELRKRAHTLQY